MKSLEVVILKKGWHKNNPFMTPKAHEVFDKVNIAILLGTDLEEVLECGLYYYLPPCVDKIDYGTIELWTEFQQAVKAFDCCARPVMFDEEDIDQHFVMDLPDSIYKRFNKIDTEDIKVAEIPFLNNLMKEMLGK